MIKRCDQEKVVHMLKPNTPQETYFGLSAPAIADFNNIGYRGDLGKQYVILISERVKAVEQTDTHVDQT